MRPPSPQLLARAVALTALVAVAGCASTSGSKGKPERTVILATVYDDAHVGREVSEDVESQMGVLEDPALQSYVDRIGRKQWYRDSIR